MMTFREGQLIFHDQLGSDHPIADVERLGHPYPGFLHRLGLMPYYAVFILVLAMTYQYFNRARSIAPR